MLDREQTKKFIKLMRQFDAQQQMGMCLVIEGLKLMDKKNRALAARMNQSLF